MLAKKHDIDKVQDTNRKEPDIVVGYLFKIIFNGPLRLMANGQLPFYLYLEPSV
jgi:hypothetical protein